MVYRFYGKYGELARIKLWTKTGEKELIHTVKLEHHPETNEVIAYVQCAIVIRGLKEEGLWKNKKKPEYWEQDYPICVGEKCGSLFTLEEFKKKEKEFKAQIAENVRNNYTAISAEIRSIWEWD